MLNNPSMIAMLIYTGFRVLYAFVKKKMKKKHFITLKKLASRTRPLSIPSLIPNILSSGIQTFIRPININKNIETIIHPPVFM